jgi:hypothetical protein
MAFGPSHHYFYLGSATPYYGKAPEFSKMVPSVDIVKYLSSLLDGMIRETLCAFAIVFPLFIGLIYKDYCLYGLPIAAGVALPIDFWSRSPLVVNRDCFASLFENIVMLYNNEL